MPEYLELLILFGVGVLAGVLNVMAGGGSSLTLPVLIFLGLDSPMANGTNRVALLLQNVSAVLSYSKEKVTDIKVSVKLAALTIPGAILGALIAVRISDEWFERILGIVMIGIIISMLIPQSKKEYTGSETKRTWIIYPVMFGIGLYGGFIQVGVGFLIMAALYHLLRLNLLFVNMHKVFVICGYSIVALAIFAWRVDIRWGLGVALAAGAGTGGFIGASLSMRHGEKLIRWLLQAVLIVFVLKLLFF